MYKCSDNNFISLTTFNKCSFLVVLILLICSLIGCQNSGITNTSNDPGGSTDPHNFLLDISGTWKSTSSSYSFTINSLNVLFQYPNPVPPGATVTYGNFQYISYDGSIVNIYDCDKSVISFTAVIVNNTLTLSGLNTIKVFPDPFDSRDYRPWNTTYTKQ